MTRLYAYGIGALALLAIFMGLYVWGQQGHAMARQALAEGKAIATQRDAATAALEAFNRRLLRAQELTIARIAQAEAQRKAAEARARKLDDALRSSPHWADEQVPDSVWGVLGGAEPETRAGLSVDSPRRR